MIIYNNIMFSKRNSNILKNDPNSMFDIGQKLSHTSIRNISIDNPSENPNMQLALNKINALPTIAPTTLNKFAITKSNNIQKNVDIEEFILSINEADKTLQTISIIVNNIDSQQILTGGAENDDINYSDIFKDNNEEYNDNKKAIKIEKQAELEQLDNDLNSLKSYDDIYQKEDPDKIIEQMRIFRSNLNYKERVAAEKYLLDIYPDANLFTLASKYIPDNIYDLPSINDINAAKRKRDQLYNELNPKKSKSVKIETKPSKPINSGISNKKVYSSKSNFNIPVKFETEPQQSINEQNKEEEYEDKDIEAKLHLIEEDYDFLMEYNEIYKPSKETLERCSNNKITYDADSVIKSFKLLEKKQHAIKGGDKASKTQALNYLKKVYGNDLSDNEIIDKIPFDLYDLPPESQYDKKLEELQEQHERLTDIMGIKKENSNLKTQTKTLTKQADILEYFKSKEPILNAMTKFNSQINRLLIFFKGKIKPNLKIISKNDISEALEDMDILNQNFKDVYLQVHNKFHNIFGVKRLGNKQSDQFLETLASNFNKISAEIIYGFKSYSNISSYSQGGFLLPSVVRQNVYKGNKYLL
jgi:hypothetical protein